MILRKYNIFAASALVVSALAMTALTSCDNEDTPVGPNDKPGEQEFVGDGTIVIRPELENFFNLSADHARSAIAANSDKRMEWTDEESGFMFTATTVPNDTVPAAGADSRGLPMGQYEFYDYKETGQYTNFDNTYRTGGLAVTAFAHDGSWNPDAATVMFRDKRFKRTDNGWRQDEKYYWPQVGGVHLVGYTPNDARHYEGKIVEPSDANYASATPVLTPTWNGNRLQLTYHAPHYAYAQPDIMVVTSDPTLPVNGGSEGPTLKFKHILAALRIRVAVNTAGASTVKFNRINIKFPVSYGTYDVESDSWSNTGLEFESGNWGWSNDGKADHANPLINNRESYDFKAHAFNDVQLPEQTYMVVPQNLKGAVIRLVWSVDGTSKDVSYTLNQDVQLKAGTVTYIDIQEPSIFVEGYQNCRQKTDVTGRSGWTDDNEWPIPWLYRLDNHQYVKRAFDHLRLRESSSGNYYESNYWFAYLQPVPRGSDNPSDLSGHATAENTAWNNNDRQYYGHRLQFNILSRHAVGSGNDFYQPVDMRQDYFLVGYASGQREITKKYKCRTGNWHREAYGGSPSDWDINNMGGSGWQGLDGHYKIRITPSREEVTFTIEGSGDHQVIYPDKIVVTGSTFGFPQLTVQPRTLTNLWAEPLEFKGDSKKGLDHEPSFDNIRSYNLKYLQHVGGGLYEGRVEVNQFAPFDMGKETIGGVHWIDTNWLGHGSVVMYMSTMHGSYGHEDKWPFEEYESRIGVTGSFGAFEGHKNMFASNVYSNLNKSWTIRNVGRMYSNSAIWLPIGVYDFRYNMITCELTYKFVGRLGTACNGWDGPSNNVPMPTKYEYFVAPYNAIPYPAAIDGDHPGQEGASNGGNTWYLYDNKHYDFEYPWTWTTAEWNTFKKLF